MTITVTEVWDEGNDVLKVIGKFTEGDTEEAIEATGWVSATTNHFKQSDYDSSGNLKKNA